MYNKYLEVFIDVADTGSFSKTAEKFYMSPAGVMKQINALENEINLPLLIRSNQGVTLTEAGKQIYKDAKSVIEFCNKSIEKARKQQNKNCHFISIGTSLICPCKPLIDLWYQVSNNYPNFKIKIVPFEDNHLSTLTTLKSNDTNIDFIVSPCDSKQWLENFDFLKLGEYKFCIAVPTNHPLAEKESIDYSDFSNQSVMVITGGDSKQNEKILNNIKSNCENVEIKDAPFFYDINVFNTCEENGYLLIVLECWKDVHPAFKVIPLASGETLPYGIIYSKNPSPDATEYLNIIKGLVK